MRCQSLDAGHLTGPGCQALEVSPLHELLLLVAENPSIQAAFLVDPVDNTKFSPESPDSLSASKALAASGRAVGISGAAVIGSCNPEGSNYKVCVGGGLCEAPSRPVQGHSCR